ncbi:MAG: DUF1326 domain-containing protein [Planctomycetes bacterium]|nr:DUF1326 domain-containing protein [Planctomycetota bacterium]
MLHSALLLPLLAPTGAESAPVSGHYVEARTASVFAGACHYNGEFVTAGRDALCAWRIEAGAFGGVDLAGVAIAAIVAGESNLDERGTRGSVVLVDAALTPERALAAVRWLVATRAALLGDVVEVRATSLALELAGDAYALSAEGVALRGSALPDRACCAMPQMVWYRPLEPLAGTLVGLDETFAVEVPALGRAWSRPGENAAFLGRFGAH